MSLKTVKLKATEFIVNSSAGLYNLARFLYCSIDQFLINLNSKRGKPFILIYQQGRVASTSVYESIKSLNLSYPVHHVHTISYKHAQGEIDRLKKKGGKVYRHFFVGKYLYKALNRHNLRDNPLPWKIICIFRDPIEIMISLHFLNLDNAPNNKFSINGELDKKKTLAFFENLFENNDPSNWAICNWFDDVFFKELGIDVFLTPFDKTDGYTLISSNKMDVLLIRFENLEQAYKQGTAKLLGLNPNDINLQHENLHVNKSANELHKYIKQNLKLSKNACEKVYSTKFVQHFYSPELIEILTSKWTR